MKKSTARKNEARKKIWPLHPTVIELQEEKEAMALQLFPMLWKLIYTQIPGVRLL